MPSPTFVFAIVMATLYGAIFHLIRGGDVRRLALFLLAGWIGFVLGQMVGMMIGLQILMVGSIHLIPATFGSFLSLFFVQIVALHPVD